jgi:2-dehydro-3-deoxyphosphogluconate aldolase/(4S)-4-hydroxy-2-oxoglutarate aldolase
MNPSLLSRCPVVPVVVLDDPDQALPLGKALLAGEIDVVEITLRTDAGLEAIRRLATLPDLHLGAGSVLVPDQVDQVVEAGARFVFSPGLSVDVVQRCRALDVPTLPGVATASELMTARPASSADRRPSAPSLRRSPAWRSCPPAA